MKAPRFQYHKRTVEDVKARANYRGGSYDSYTNPKFKVYKVREGKNILRILPPTWEKPNHYGYTIWVNYGIGADSQAYLSLSKMKKEKDPIAEARVIASREGDDKLARALDARERVLMWVIDRNAEEEGPQLWAAPVTVDKVIAGLSLDEDTKEVSYIDDPATGRDLRFYKEGQGLLTKYPAEKMKLLAETPLSEDDELAADWLALITENPLPSVLQFYDYDHIAAAFDGQARVEEDDAPTPKRARPAVADEEPKKPPKNNGQIEDDDEPRDPAPRRAPIREPDSDERPASMSIRERLAARNRTPPKSPDPEDD